MHMLREALYGQEPENDAPIIVNRNTIKIQTVNLILCAKNGAVSTGLEN
jgi:hypothetical protein